MNKMRDRQASTNAEDGVHQQAIDYPFIHYPFTDYPLAKEQVSSHPYEAEKIRPVANNRLALKQQNADLSCPLPSDQPNKASTKESSKASSKAPSTVCTTPLTQQAQQAQQAQQQAQAGFYRWQHSTRSANQALLKQQYHLAEQHYQRALCQAEQLQQLDPLADSHIAAFVISLHNLADLALLNGIPSQARTLLCRAYQSLWQLCWQHQHPLLWPHLQVCRRELAFFCQSFGSDSTSQQLLQQPWPTSAPAH